MSDLEARLEIFGQPSVTLAPEAAWMYREENGRWPLLEEVTPAIQELARCDETEAEARLLTAIEKGEVRSLVDEGDRDWLVTISQETADRIERRYLDMTLRRKETHESST